MLKRVLACLFATAATISACKALADDSSQKADKATQLAYIQADKLQDAGLTGKSIRVGVISDGLDGLDKVQAAGAVPHNIGVIANDSGSGGEGVAMLEIIHAIAPDAQLYFCTHYNDAGCFQSLKKKFNVDIAVDDLGHRDKNMSPSPESVEVEQILKNNPASMYITAGGNDAKKYTIGSFTPTSITIDGQHVQAQDFGRSRGNASNPYEHIDIPDGQSGSACFMTSEDDSYPTPSSNDKLAIWLLDSDGNVLAKKQTQEEEGCVQYTNHGKKTVTVSVAVGVIAKNNDFPLEIMLESEDYKMDAPAPTGAGDQFGPAKDVLVVGAAARKGAGFTSDDTTMEPFSQAGPYTVAWGATQTGTDEDGVPELSYTRLPKIKHVRKPDLTGEDDWTITSNPHFSDGGTVFYGTSAAAPSVAGVAALLMQTGIDREKTTEALKQSAKHLKTDQYGDPISAEQGQWDQFDGYGLIQGYDALKATGIPIPQPSIKSPSKDVKIEPGDSVTFKGDCALSSGKIKSYAWDFGNKNKSDKQNPGKITYKTAGTYTVEFNCTSDKGIKNPDSTTRKVEVRDPPPPPSSHANSSGGGGALGFLFIGWFLFAATIRRERSRA